MKSVEIKSMRGSGGPILSIAKLCTALRVAPSFLSKVRGLSDEDRYSPARVKAAKSDGSKREVFNPSRDVRRIQSRIVTNILRRPNAIRWHDFLFGSMPNQAGKNGVTVKKDYVTCAAVHCEAKSVLKIDIKNFFGNVHSDSVFGIWSGLLGFSDDVAHALTDLCLRDDSLPQGGITSSYLAMLCLHDVEASLVATLRRKGLRYTRYVDDITVSSPIADYDFGLALSLVRNMLISKAMPVNESKVVRATLSTDAAIVHGLRVSFPTPRLPSGEVAKIRAAVRTIEKLAEHPNFVVSTSYRRSYNKCMGRVNKLRRVGHTQHSNLVDRLKKIRPLPSRKDIRKVIVGIRKLVADHPVRGGSFGYRKRYFVLMERVNLVARRHKRLAQIFRSFVRDAKPIREGTIA